MTELELATRFVAAAFLVAQLVVVVALWRHDSNRRG